MRIAIIGAGVGGLSAAINLRTLGADVHVYEQAPAAGDVGAGLVISPNAGRILRHMGLFEKLCSIGCEPSAYIALSWQSGETVTRETLGVEPDGLFELPTLGVHRGQLVELLAEALPAEILHFGHQFTGLKQDESGVTAHFVDGETIHADVLIGADGIKSAVARAIGVPTVPRSSGYAAYRGLVPTAAVADLNIEPALYTTFGPNSHFVQYYIASGELLNVVGIVPSEDREESWSREGDIQQVRAIFREWHPRVTEVLSRMDNVSLWGLYDRPVREIWGTGRVGLLGDAIHPMLPFFAQGAAQAIEDAAALAVLLTSVPDSELPHIWERYSSLRLERVRRIQQTALHNSVMFHLADGEE